MTRTWIARIAQEYMFEAETADDALAFVNAAAERPITGATLGGGEAYLSEKKAQGAGDE